MRTIRRSQIFHRLKQIPENWRMEDGSATLEFLILGLPLFLPLVMYLTHIYQDSHSQFDLQNYSRQLARAYVSSNDESTADSRIEIVREEFEKSLFGKGKFVESPQIRILCSANPCLTMGGDVEIQVQAIQLGTKKRFEAKTIESVDQWRD